MELKETQMVESFRLLTKNIVHFFENNLLNKANISCSELNVLKVLCESEKEDRKMNVTELANSLNMSKSAASQLVSKLEKKGFVKRKINLFDKKVNYISITDEARKGYEDNTIKYNEVIDKVIEKMGEEDSKQLSRLLEKLSDIIYNLEEVA